MGPGRSLRKLHARYRQQVADDPSTQPPTTRFPTIRSWSHKYDWQERARAYDKACHEWQEEQVKETLRQGLALPHHRVEKLKKIFERLDEELTGGALWLQDKKQLGKGADMEIIDIERYNSSLISDLRGLLDDLAQETGGRIKRQDITSGGQPLQMEWTDEDASGDK